jgi:4-hydroxy-tetrahydrodipicolinate synthase
MNDEFVTGSIAALVTPFADAGAAVDETVWRALVKWHGEAGTDGIVVAGTTGESAALSRSERDALLEQALEAADGRMRVIAGTGSASTDGAVAHGRRAAELGADAVLVVAPYYNRPPQRGLAAHFRRIADDSPVPVILYNVPTRTAVDLAPETVTALADHPNVVAIKEAVADMDRVREYAACGLTVLSGDDPSAWQALQNGASGVISVAANVVPRAMRRLCRLARKGETAAGDRLQRELEPLFAFLAVESNPLPVKWLLARAGRIAPHLRLPLVALHEQHHAAGQRLVEAVLEP